MPRISRVWSRDILDSRATPTIETVVQLDTGHIAVASVPSGASTGKYEAVELRDGDQSHYAGKGVQKAVNNVNQILGPAVVGMEVAGQAEIDRKMIELDKSENKSNLGANAILSISTAVTKVAAMAANMPLHRWVYELSVQNGAVASGLPSRVPTPIFNMINGGMHGAGNLDFQEFQIIPATSKPYSESIRAGCEIYYAIKDALIRRGAIHSIGDEGGYAPNLFTNADALTINLEAISNAKYQIGADFFLGVDIAANTLYRDGAYSIKDKSNPLNGSSFITFYEQLAKDYRLTLLEDPLQEDDWDGWVQLTEKLGQQLLVVGDDLLVTNLERVKKAIEKKACNAILVKPNQIGSISETLEVIKLARSVGWKIIISHRSGETNDWFIADFAVGVKSEFVKFGAPARGERVAKYNRLMSIEGELAAQKAQQTNA
jgi:enolase